MARIFITGSTDGLGRAAARSLLDDGHGVVLHARSTERACTLADLEPLAAGVVIGDLSSAAETGLHRSGEGSLRDLDWTQRPWNPARAYAESKLHVVALALFVARRWPQLLSNAVDPGWARTRMGGANAPVDIYTGQRTQSWLAVSTDRAAMVTGRYWHDMAPELPAAEAMDVAFQDKLVARLQELTGVAFPEEIRSYSKSIDRNCLKWTTRIWAEPA
jgi:NAD(P)-dependent dehydrogenase (short-subunit alcohol dehydrogenase family)